MKKVYVVAGDWEEREYPHDHAHYVYGVFDTKENANEIFRYLQKLLKDESSTETVYLKEYELNSTTEDYKNVLGLYV